MPSQKGVGKVKTIFYFLLVVVVTMGSDIVVVIRIVIVVLGESIGSSSGGSSSSSSRSSSNGYRDFLRSKSTSSVRSHPPAPSPRRSGRGFSIYEYY
jgi:hypothetical protein